MRQRVRTLVLLGFGCLFVMLAAAASAAPPAHARHTIPEVLSIQDRSTSRLMAVPDVVGTATGLGEDGEPVILVLTKRGSARGLPAALNGVPVRMKVTGELRALPQQAPALPTQPPGVGGRGGRQGSDGTRRTTDPTQRFSRPVPIGVSTGNEGECSAGTISARVTDGTNVYALSNNHVFARENLAPLGSRVLQPGPYDTRCAANPNDAIGTLTAFVPIVMSQAAANTVDGAIARSSTTALGQATPSDGYGTPSTTIAPAVVGQAVQKYGRTTRLTRGTITAIHATVDVSYASGVARFVDQLIIEAPRAVIKPGDSGSLAVTNDAAAHPVGLLFAGNASGTVAVANRIEHVLGAFGVTVDGQ